MQVTNTNKPVATTHHNEEILPATSKLFLKIDWHSSAIYTTDLAGLVRLTVFTSRPTKNLAYLSVHSTS